MAKTTKQKMVTERVQLTIPAKEVLTAISKRNAMTQLSIMSRLCEWFASQPTMIQNGVLKLYPPEIEKGVAELIRKELGK